MPIWNLIGLIGLLLSGSVLYAASPQIWFAPLDDASRQLNTDLGIIPSSDSGPTDYMDLFSPGAPWAQAASHVSVFLVSLSPFTGVPSLNIPAFSDAQLQEMFSFLKLHNIAFALEWGPLTVSGGCGAGIEGFTGIAAQTIIDRVKANGGTLSYIAMDEPFQHAHDVCNWTPQQVAANAAVGLNILKAAFPGLIIGDVEVVPNISESDWLQQYPAWMDAFHEATGSKLAFFDCDTGFTATWMNDATALRAEIAARGIMFGVIYDGFQSDSSDVQWLTHAQQNFTNFELTYGQPDRAILQSWQAHPINSLPETTPYTFTWLIDQYMLQRPNLSLNDSGTQATGKLVDAQGNGVGAATIDLTMQPTSGGGVIATYTLTGTVPITIDTALIQICVNLCGGQGTNSMDVYSFHYADSGNQTTLDFSQGLAAWGVDGNGTALVKLGSDSNGPFLQTAATGNQSTFVNSQMFTVTPGSNYTLTVRARISPDSVGSGYFAQIFLAGTESSRDSLPFAPGTVTLGTTQTSSDGSYSLHFSPPSADTYQLQASFAGSTTLWPALASIALNAGLPSCAFSVNPGGQAFAPGGGTGTVKINATEGCSWSSLDTLSWVTFSEDVSGNGTGNGTISYQVLPNSGGDRSGTLTIAGISFSVEQEAAAASLPGLSFIGSFPHIAAEENWTTAFTLVNKSAASAQHG